VRISAYVGSHHSYKYSVQLIECRVDLCEFLPTQGVITRAVITVFFSGFASGATGDEESDLDKVVPGVAEEEQKLADFEGVACTHTCRYTHTYPRTLSFSCPLFSPLSLTSSFILDHIYTYMQIHADTCKPIHAQFFFHFLPFAFSFFLSVFFFLTRSHVRIHADTRTPIHAQSFSFFLSFFLSFRHFLSLTCSHIHVHSDTRTEADCNKLQHTATTKSDVKFYILIPNTGTD